MHQRLRSPHSTHNVQERAEIGAIQPTPDSTATNLQKRVVFLHSTTQQNSSHSNLNADLDASHGHRLAVQEAPY